MNKPTKLFLAASIALSFLTGCGSSNVDTKTEAEYSNSHNGNQGSQGNGKGGYDQQEVDNTYSAITNEQKYSLAYMWNEERLAKDIYLALNELYPAKQFENIASKSEQKHIDAVEGLIAKYDINITNLVDYSVEYSEAELRAMPAGTYGVESVQQLYNDLFAKGKLSKIDALQVACMVEVTDVNDLNEFIETAEKVNATDLVSVFDKLRSGSYNHYWAFDSALKAEGVSDGCASLGVDYAKTEAEFPVNQRGNQGNSNNGQGNENQEIHNNNTNQQQVGNTQSVITNDQKYSLAYMWNEERLAKDIYLALNELYPAKQFENIASKSEQKHIDAVEGLIAKYDINITNLVDYSVEYSEAELRAMPAGTYGVESVQQLYNDLFAKGKLSKIDALQVACMVEVTDVNDLNEFIETAEKVNATDLVSVFDKLRSGSYNHYWAFDSALKAEGVSDGCASLGADYAKTEEEYPSSHGGNGQGGNTQNGNGKGKGRGKQ